MARVFRSSSAEIVPISFHEEVKPYPLVSSNDLFSTAWSPSYESPGSYETERADIAASRSNRIVARSGNLAGTLHQFCAITNTFSARWSAHVGHSGSSFAARHLPWL